MSNIVDLIHTNATLRSTFDYLTETVSNVFHRGTMKGILTIMEDFVDNGAIATSSITSFSSSKTPQLLVWLGQFEPIAEGSITNP